MPGPAAVLQILVTANTAQAQAALAKTQTQLQTTQRSATGAGSAFNKAFGRAAATGTLIAFGAVVTQSVKKSAEFQKQMTLIQTQAGASANEVKNMSAALLDMAKSGSEFDPIELAKGLYRVESAGYRGTRALNVLKTAADFAAVGQADLEQSTFALTGTMKTGIKGSENLAKTAGTLNAIIGQGSMRMDDLNSAIGTGFFSNAKQMGLSLQQAGSALAALTRQGQPATQGATRLSMAFRMLGAPTDKAKEAMKGIGLEWFKLSKMMQAGQFPAAVHELVQHLNALGEGAAGRAKAAAVIREIFGARSATGINTIIQGLKDYDQILIKTNEDQNKFGEDVKKQQSTLSAQWEILKSKITAYEIEIGDKARPVITEALKQINQGMQGKGIAGAAFKIGAASVRNLFKEMTRLPSAGASVVKAFVDMGHGGNIFRKALTAVNEVAKKVIGIDFGAVPRKIKDAWGGLKDILTHPFSSALHLITGFINDIIGVINTVLGPVGVHIGTVGGGGKGNVTPFPKNQSSGNKQKGVKKQKGGVMVPGQGLGDKVAAMLEPGEFVLNRKAVQAIGLANLKRTNRQFPRFQMGGGVQGLQVGGAASGAANVVTSAFSGGVKMPKLPGVGSLPEWIQPVGKFVLSKVGAFIKDKLTGYFTGGPGGTVIMDGKPVAPWIAQILQRARASGVGFNVTSGYRTYAEQLGLQGGPGPVAPAGTSHHEGLKYPSGAVDISPGALALAGWLGTKKGQRINMGRLVYAGAKDPVHFSHPYGGGYQKGGAVRYAKYLKHGDHWLHPHNPISASEGATLLWQAGMSPGDAARLSTVLPDESGGSWTSLNRSSGAAGIWQILGRASGSPAGSLFNPIVNSINAAIKWRTQGPSAWPTYPGSGPRGHILRNLVFSTKGTTGSAGTANTGVGGKATGTTFGLDVGSSYDSAQANADLLQEILANWEGARSSMIDLISSGNLEVLQRYQTGVAQNPLLGIPTPNMPTLASTNLPSAMDMYLRSIGINPAASTPYTYPGMGSNANNSMSFRGEPIHSGITHHTHVHVDGKEIAHVVEKLNRRSSRRGNRPLPGARGR